MFTQDPETGLKICYRCKIPKTSDDFNRNKRMPDGLNNLCKECRKPDRAAYYEANTEEMNFKINTRRRAHPEMRLLASARWRARDRGISCNITLEDIPIPERCPLCERLLAPRNDGKRGPAPYSPSIDRYVPSLGYTKGNVWIICNSCNQHKNDMSGEDLLAFAIKLIDTYKEYCERMAQLSSQEQLY